MNRVRVRLSLSSVVNRESSGTVNETLTFAMPHSQDVQLTAICFPILCEPLEEEENEGSFCCGGNRRARACASCIRASDADHQGRLCESENEVGSEGWCGQKGCVRGCGAQGQGQEVTTQDRDLYVAPH